MFVSKKLLGLIIRIIRIHIPCTEHKALCETTSKVQLILTRFVGIDCTVWEQSEEISDGVLWILGGSQELNWSGPRPAHMYERPCCSAVQVGSIGSMNEEALHLVLGCSLFQGQSCNGEGQP